MGDGLYSTGKKDFDKSLDLTKIKPYGDTMNDGRVQLSFTLPVDDGEKAHVAAKTLARKMGLKDPSVVYHTQLDKGFTFFVLYGSLIHTLDYTNIYVESVEVKTMSMNEVNDYIKEKDCQRSVV